MASLFPHLRVLLWKNWLGVKRQPLWSFVLVAWPVFSFILVAMIRIRFPPEPQTNCYLAPRNLPSAGFFPFLQTVLCSTDATCKNTPYILEDLLPNVNGISPIHRKQRRSANLEKDSNPSFHSAFQSRNGSSELMDSISSLKSTIENISSSAAHARIRLRDKILHLGKMSMQKSPAMPNLKSGICEVMSEYASSQNVLWEVLGSRVYQTFCFSNMSLMESFFQEFRSQFPKLQQDHQYQAAFVKEAVSFLSLFSQVQNETSIWRILLMAPDITQGVIHMKDMLAALQNTNRVIMDMEKDIPLNGSYMENLINSLLCSKNCSEQGKNNSVITQISELSQYWKDNQKILVQMNEVLRKISSDFASGDLKMASLSKTLEIIKKSLYIFKDLQDKLNTTELKNLELFKQSEKTILRLSEILQSQMEQVRGNKSKNLFNKETIYEAHNLTSLLLQNDLNGLPLYNLMTHLRETQDVFNVTRNILDLKLLNRTSFKSTKTGQLNKTSSSHKFPYMTEKIRRYISAMVKVPPLLERSLFTPTTLENLPEKLLTLQELFGIIGNVNTSYGYLFISYLKDLMQKIQNSIDDSQWNEFNFYWRIGEKLRSAKLNDTDIIAYGQILDILHKSLYIPHSNSGLPLKKELEQLNKFVKYLVEEYGEEYMGGTKVSVVLDAIMRTLHVLEDLGRKYIKELSSTNPLMTLNNETIQRFFQIFKEGVNILSDPRLAEETSINKIVVLFNFSHLLHLQEFYKSPVWHNTSVEAKVLELLYLSLSPFLSKDIQSDERFPNCTVKDFHFIAIEMLFKNATLKEALARSNCSFLFASLNMENRTIHNHTFTKLFQNVIRDLKLMPAFDTFHKNKSKHFLEEFQCLVKSLQLSSTFLSNLNSFRNYKNPWIEKMHKSLTAISNNLPQSNLTCQGPLFGSMEAIKDFSALHILAPFMLNETIAYSFNLSGDTSGWNQSLSSFILLHSEPHKNVVSKMLEVGNNAVNQVRDFSKVLRKVADMLSTHQNITTAKQYIQLLEMMRKAIIYVGVGLAPNKTETRQFLQTLSWGMNATYLESVLDSFKLFINITSDSDYKTYLKRLFTTVSPPIDVYVQSLFYLNPYWKETNKILNLSRMIWNKLFLNKTSLALIRKWETIKTFISAVSARIPEEMWNLNPLSTQQNDSSLHFNIEVEKLTRLLSHVLQKYDKEDSQSNSASERIHTVLRNLFSQKNFGHGFNISQLETIPLLTSVNNKTIQRVYEILRKGAIMLSDSRLEAAADKDRIATLYSFSQFLFPKEFNQYLLGHSTLLETKIVDILHLSLSPFLDTRNHRTVWPQNCSPQDVMRILFQMLFKNATFQESLKHSHCGLFFTFRDFENRTMSNQKFTELLQTSIRNLELIPELASLYKNNNEYVLSALSCIIKSLQFSSGLLSKVDILFKFKNPWIKEIYRTLATVSKELPPNHSMCLIPVLHGTNTIVNYYSSNILPPFIINDTAFHLQNVTENLATWNNLIVFFSALQEKAHQDSPMDEILQILEDDLNQSVWRNFSEIWNMVSKWNPTKLDYTKLHLKLADQILSQRESIPKILETSVSVVKKVMFLDLLKDLKEDLDSFFPPNMTSLDDGFDDIIDSSIIIAKALFNKTLLRNEQTPFPNHVIARLLFSEFENIFLRISPNNDFRMYLSCAMKVTERLDNKSSENATLSPNLAQLQKVLLVPHDISKKNISVPEMLMLRLSHLQDIISLLCDSESIKSLQETCQLPDTSFSELCKHSESHKKLLRDLELSDQIVTTLIKERNVTEEFRKIVIGDLTKLQKHITWFQESVPQLNYFRNIPRYMASVNSILNITKNTARSRKPDMLTDLFRNIDRFRDDLRNTVGMSTESIDALMEMPLPENRMQLLFQILQLESCNTDTLDAQLEVVAKEFCNLSVTERTRRSYVAVITVLQYLDVYKFIYKMLLPEELQTSLNQMIDLLKDLDHFKNQFASDLQPLLAAVHSLKDLEKSRSVPLSKALFQASHLTLDRGTFNALSKALCNQEITPLFFESLLPDFEEQNVHHSSVQDDRVQHVMKKYGIPQDSTPFCLSFFLDLVKTPTRALIWSFLKPMLLGKILYTPNTPETQAIMEKSNSTLKLMAELTKKSQEWLDNSPMIINSLTTLNETIPIVKNALRNPFVQVFIKLMVKLDAVDLLYQIDELDDIRSELQNNADILNQLTILSRLAANVSSCVFFDRIRPFNTTEELEAMAKDLFLKNELFGSIIFKLPSDEKNEEEAPSGLSLPPLINYTIRMSSKISQTTKRIREKVWTVGPHNSASQSQIYSRAFVYLQDSIERAIIELQTGKSIEEIGVQVQATPYPCYNKDMFLTSVTYSLPFTLMAAWVLYIAAFVKKLVQEKDLRLYEYMKMMGVNSSSHFFAWFIECAAFLLITVTFLIAILKVGNILPKINVVILFLYLTDYSFSIIAMCYLISVFFNNTNIAALVGSLVYILTFFPFIVLLVVENHVSFSVKSLLSLLSPTAFSYASQYIARYEEQGIGLQWENMYSSPMSGDDTNFGWMCWMILIDSFIYFILGWYISNVFPGTYGMAAPWYFPLLPSYWAERYGYFPFWNEKRKGLLFTNFFLRKEPTYPEKTHVQSALPSNLEPEPSNLPVGVSLHGITKIYESKAAVQNLNLNFYEGNITSLLGHNGAGKTTTISILTGLFPATSGTIFVYGNDIRTDQDIIRKNMGICMQHNVLFSYLSTKEHLLLYGYIKVPHWSKEELREEVKRTLKETGLYNHRYKLAGSLSGGMKRKLSISIALLGGSKVVILDEPTTGVDPCSRRGIWDIISKNKKGRTIILSTHHLDEAEVLSDRIAFLEDGGLKCCGSPFYLKEMFGSGYHLILTKKKTPGLGLPEGCDTSAVTAMIQSHLPEADLKEDIGGELVYVLPPFNSSVSAAYQSLLKGLDSGLDDLHIGYYGISDSTVEEVFLNLTKDLSKGERTSTELPEEVPTCILDKDEMNADNFTEKDDQALVRSRKPNDFPLLLRKAAALFVKRFHHTRRNVKGFIAQVILPVLFVTTAMGLGNLRTEVAEYPPLHLTPSLYGTSDQADFFGNYNETTDALVASVLSFPGVDNTCLNTSNLACFEEVVSGEWMFSGNQSTQYSVCNCTGKTQICPKVDALPPHKKTFSSRTIYNLTGHDIETYLLVTAKEFVQKRYGGWSFGLPLTSDLKFDVRPVPANRTITKVWYNPEGYHSLPAYLNSLNNFILRANLPQENSSKYGISVVAHPYPGGESQEQAMLSSLLDIIVSMSILIGYSITTASFVLYVVKEHQTKAKQLQHISGIGVTSYWVTNFIFDLVYFLIPVTLSLGVISAFQIPAFFNDNNLLAVFLLLFLFGYATFSWMYLLAGIFKETGMAFIVYVCINLFFGINTIITHSVVFLISQEKATDQGLHDLAETLRHVFLLFPQFCFGYGLIELSQHQALMGFLKAYGVVYPDKTFELDRTSSKLLGMFLQGTIFFAIRLLIDDGTIQKLWYNVLEFFFNKLHGNQLLDYDDEEDKDVRAERERVTSGLANYDMLQLQNLTKIYHHPRRRIVAVNNVNIGIPAGECFGLLGVNGAGKTTIFKMLTGDIAPSSGRLLVQDETGSLNDVDDAHWSLFGYCPQEDALDDFLTVEEHMYYYARLHGIPEKHIRGIVFQLLYRLNLMPYRCRVTSKCSYGTNRKLSTALALLGKPSILLLDEPSSGMDPNAKRHLWKIITEEVQNHCSVILTSHSMEECEALCTRLAIMVNGQFQCLGSLQHIKSRFGKGFTVKMHLDNGAANIEKLTEFIQTNFPNTVLKDHQLNMVEYHVPVSAGGVANIFQLLESNKAVFKIRHFSVSQTTLEEVFINFAKDQGGPDALDMSSDVGSVSSDGQDSDITVIY